MPSDSSTNHGLAAFVLIGLSSAIGFIIFTETGDAGTLTTWFWAGIGLAGIYLLSTIANSLDELREEY